MALPQDLALILDHARAEAKRRDHAQVMLAHVAAVLVRRDRDRFTATFGPDAPGGIEAILKGLPTCKGSFSDAPELGELLTKVAAAPNVAGALDEEILELLVKPPEAAPAESQPQQSASVGSSAGQAGAPKPHAKEGSANPQEATATAQPAPIDKPALLEQLRQRIVGQDAALKEVVDRLALTRMQLDLRPHRPDGVFMLAGPSGTGKTAFGRALAEHLFGDEGRLISLDMSEYAHDWALSRLIGPQPGYVGSDKPEGWLTTRVRRQPQSVIILDEIEKSHPTVWNTFLQVFDDGRLTDGQGNEADFSRTVILMTSNLGSENFRQKHPIGFAADSSVTELSDRTLEAVKRTMPPEFINRLDAILVFKPLTPEIIREITGREIERVLGRLRERGYDTEVPPEVVAYIAEEGYDPAYGARHVHRSIEQHLLETLVDQLPGRLRARVLGKDVEWAAASTGGSASPA